MDPLSIAAAAINLCNITTKCSMKLAKFIRDSKHVDEAVRTFQDETSSLEGNLKIVSKTILSTVNISGVPNLHECLESVDKTITHGTKIIDRLLDVVDQMDPKDAPDFFRRALKQIKVDGRTEEITFLRLQMLSCNTSFQTILQAINISLTLSVQGQTYPPYANAGLYESMQLLHNQISQLRSDIREQAKTQALEGKERNEEDRNKDQEQESDETYADHPDATEMISSMQLVQSVAERVYSSASTAAESLSMIGSDQAPELTGEKRDQIDRYLLSLDSAPEKLPRGVTGIDDLKVEQLLSMLEDIRSNIPQNLFKARDLGLHALEVVESLDISADIVDTGIVTLLLALIYTFLGGEENLVLARRHLDMVDVAELSDAVPTPQNVEKLSMLCWTLYHLQHFEEAEKYCFAYINCARAQADARDRQEFFASVVLMVFIKYCQFQPAAAETWAKLITNEYLNDKYWQASNEDLLPNREHGDWKILPRKDFRHAATLYALNMEDSSQSQEEKQLALLDLAAAGGFIGIIALLINKGSTVELTKARRCVYTCGICRTREFTSPVQIAAYHGHIIGLKYMIEKGGGLESLDPQRTCLSEAISNGKLDVARWLMDNGSMHPTQRGRFLSQAIQQREFEIAELFIERGVDLNEEDRVTGLPPLHLACRVHCMPLVSLLLDQGASIEQRDSNGQSPLFGAIEPEASQEGLDCVCVLLQRGADVDGKIYETTKTRTVQFGPEHLLTPLQYVIKKKRSIHFIKILIDSGADPMALFNDGRTCFHFEVRQFPGTSLVERLQIMLQSTKPLDLNHKDSRGKTVAQLAQTCLYGETRPRVLGLLIEAGAKDPNSRWWKTYLNKGTQKFGSKTRDETKDNPADDTTETGSYPMEEI